MKRRKKKAGMGLVVILAACVLWSGNISASIVGDGGYDVIGGEQESPANENEGVIISDGEPVQPEAQNPALSVQQPVQQPTTAPVQEEVKQEPKVIEKKQEAAYEEPKEKKPEEAAVSADAIEAESPIAEPKQKEEKQPEKQLEKEDNQSDIIQKEPTKEKKPETTNAETSNPIGKKVVKIVLTLVICYIISFSLFILFCLLFLSPRLYVMDSDMKYHFIGFLKLKSTKEGFELKIAAKKIADEESDSFKVLFSDNIVKKYEREELAIVLPDQTVQSRIAKEVLFTID